MAAHIAVVRILVSLSLATSSTPHLPSVNEGSLDAAFGLAILLDPSPLPSGSRARERKDRTEKKNISNLLLVCQL